MQNRKICRLNSLCRAISLINSIGKRGSSKLYLLNSNSSNQLERRHSCWNWPPSCWTTSGRTTTDLSVSWTSTIQANCGNTSTMSCSSKKTPKLWIKSSTTAARHSSFVFEQVGYLKSLYRTNSISIKMPKLIVARPHSANSPNRKSLTRLFANWSATQDIFSITPFANSFN